VCARARVRALAAHVSEPRFLIPPELINRSGFCYLPDESLTVSVSESKFRVWYVRTDILSFYTPLNSVRLTCQKEKAVQFYILRQGQAKSVLCVLFIGSE